MLLLRERPRAEHRNPAQTARRGDGLSLAAALRTPAFWVFGGATSLFGLVSSGLGLFNEAVLAERGFDQQTYVRFLAATSIIALAGQIGVRLADAPLVDAAAARPGDVHLRGRRSRRCRC